ncbi:MAG: LysR family transcriptional regulator [Romboutsia sp.]
MNLDHLRWFYTTAKHASITKAAKELHLTQPGLSMQIQSLENEIGFSLLKRSYKGVELTDEGKVVFDYAKKMLSLENDLQSDLRNLNKKNNPLLIGSCKSIGEYALPCSIYTFKEIHNNINISLDLDNSTNIINKLQKNEINIAIIQEYTPNDDIISTPILLDKLVLVGGYHQPISSIDISDISSLQLILREDGSATRNILERNLKSNNINIDNFNIIYSLNSQQAIKNSISSQKCFSFLPEVAIRQELRNLSLKKIPINGLNIEFEYYVAYRKNYNLDKYEQLFIDFISSKRRCFCY